MYFPMERRPAGWFELVTDAARTGTQYFFRIDDAKEVPDPASRFQPLDVHGPSEVIDPNAFEWTDENWRGRRWEEAVIYELHVGTFTASGNFAGVCERLDYLAELGVTVIELMPVADFPGKRNWGYDGVFTYAPDSVYGRPEDLKRLVQSAHQRGIMVLLDVVYNHFGPEGNYLNTYAPQFLTSRHHTPWGNSINFDGEESRNVRDFFIQNALYWLTEYNFDGLRLDAVHTILDDSHPHFLSELAETVRASIAPDRYIHLVLENDKNEARYVRRARPGLDPSAPICQPLAYDAQWNDDIHHVLHLLLTAESDGYYSDYVDRPIDRLGRCLTSGFAYQGEASVYRDGQLRGESTVGLPPEAFISFLQNHDQIGNRAFGERIATLADNRAVRAAMAILLLAPSPPLLFMGEEFGTETPFLFFCDFEKGLAEAVAAGRRNEFTRFARFSDPAARAGIPDPNAASTFEASRLDWTDIEEPKHRNRLHFYKALLKLRCRHIIPRLSNECAIEANYEVIGNTGITAYWKLTDASQLILFANLGAESVSSTASLPSRSQVIFESEQAAEGFANGTLPGWSVVWFLES